MQVDETLVRSVVEQVSHAWAGGNGRPAAGPTGTGSPGGGYQGRFGLFTDVDQAVAAAREAFERLSRRTLEDRRRIIAHIRRIAIEASASSWARWRWKRRRSAGCRTRSRSSRRSASARRASSSCAARSSAAITAWRSSSTPPSA